MGWAIRLAKHLEALHLHGVAHGNVSPACVLIEDAHPSSRGLVADVRRTAEMVQYHSPERFRNGQLSPSDDAWGLAGTLFTALTATRPFGELRTDVSQRVLQGLPPLGAFGIDDDGLSAILETALLADFQRRTTGVAALRSQLEHWLDDPTVQDLPALEDEEGGEEDAAATAMLPMDRMVFEESSTSRSPESLGNIFAPASFDPLSSAQSQARPASAPRPQSRPMSPQAMPPQAPPPQAPSAQAPPPVSASPLGEQDATVMRELPAHIMAMAARAASGSNPPPPPSSPRPPQDSQPDEADFGASTRIAPAGLASQLLTQPQPAPPPPPPPRSNPGQPMPIQGSMPGSGMRTPPPMGPPQAPPSGPGMPGGRPIPRAFKSTQLGMGSPLAQPSAPPIHEPAAPRPGFGPPPATISSSPPPATRAFGVPDGGFGADDDDGGRTVMRESPALAADFMPGASAPQGAWKPAPPPMQPQAFPQPGMSSQAMPAVRPNMPPPGPSMPVSALIQETLETMGGPSPPMGQGQSMSGPPAGAPAQAAPLQPFLPPLGHESTGHGFSSAGLQGAGGGPFQPLGGAPQAAPSAGAQAVAASFNPAPWQQAGQEVSGSFALGPGASGQHPAVGGPFGPSPGPGGPFAPQPIGKPTPAAPFAPLTPPPGAAAAGAPGLGPEAGIQPAQALGPSPAGPASAPFGGYPLGSGASATPAVGKRKRSKKGLFIVCFLVLILSAAVTFSVLRFAPQLGLPIQ